MGVADFVKNSLPQYPNWLNGTLLKCNCLHDSIFGREMMRFKSSIPLINPEEKLLEIVNYSIQKVPYYRKRYGGLKINSISEFKERIGFIDKNEVMNNWDEFVAEDIDMTKCLDATTSGTSGRPLRFLMPKNRYVTEMAFITKIWQRSGWNYNCRANIRTVKFSADRDFIINPISKEIQFDLFRMSDDYAQIICNAMKKYNADTIYSYPSSAYQFLKICQRKGIDTSFIKYALLTSERITPEQYKFISDELGIVISSYYGHSEKLIMAGMIDATRFTVEPGYGFAELVDDTGNDVCEKGAIGELVGTTFYNRFMPLIRYKTGDMAAFEKYDYDDDGLKKMFLETIHGRRDKSLIYRHDGTEISDASLTLHDDFYNHIDGLQFIQTQKGYLEVLIIKNNKYTDKDEAYYKQHVSKAMLGEEFVSIKYVDKLKFLPNGKFLPVISNFN